MESEATFHQYEIIIDELVKRNFAIIEGLFDNTILAGLKSELIRLNKEGDFKQASIGKDLYFTTEKTIRSDKIHWINNHSEHPSEKAFISRIRSFSNYLNRTCYTGIQDFEFHFARFEQGNFYKRHLDQFKNDEGRKFSVITYLNENWTSEDGGQLVLYLDEKELRIVPKWGITVIFKSDLIEHEVLPAKRNRYSITGWLK